MIRALQMHDIEELTKIHAKYYKDEFPFPDFFLDFFTAFVITDDLDGSIISATAVRPIAECFALTNKDKSVRTRRNALIAAMQAAGYMTSSNGFRELHCFVQDDKWYNQLIKVGFRPTVGKPLVIGL